MLEWLAMGDYGAYVWGAYAVALGGLAAMTAWATYAHRRATRDARSPVTEPVSAR